jgi:hypothetical protein
LADLARGWFTGVLADVFPGLREGLAGGGTVGKRDPRDADRDAVWGAPGAVWAQMRLSKEPGPGGRWVQYTERAWQRFLDGLEDDPFTAMLEMYPLDERGRRNSRDGSATVRVTRLPESPQWAAFRFRAGATVVAVSSSDASDWSVFARKQAAKMHAVYGHVGYGSSEGTSLEYATRTWPAKTIPQARSELRGYEWATLIAPELLDRLGGIEGIRGSAAFCEIVKLDYGAAWLQATPEFDDYDTEAARRVFTALAPVLIGGRAKKLPGRQPPLAYGVDANDYRGESA